MEIKFWLSATLIRLVIIFISVNSVPLAKHPALCYCHLSGLLRGLSSPSPRPLPCKLVCWPVASLRPLKKIVKKIHKRKTKHPSTFNPLSTFQVSLTIKSFYGLGGKAFCHLKLRCDSNYRTAESISKVVLSEFHRYLFFTGHFFWSRMPEWGKDLEAPG